MPRTLATGEIIASRYRLEQLLGEGGMATVWAATHAVTHRKVALKFLKAPDDPKDRNRHRFLREARAASAVKHPNVVEIYDILELEDAAPVIVMEFLTGETLQQRLDREARIPLRETCRILLRVTSAVMAAHAAGVVHRDLKPENIFLATEGGAVEVKVLDFGVAKLTATEGDAARTSGLTGTGAVLGTPLYMSPEQAYGEGDVDARSDIWSMGVILYRAVAGVVPTAADNFGQIFKNITTGRIKPLAEVAPETPPEILDVVERMLRVDRDARLADLGELHAVLARYAGEATDATGAALSLGTPSAERRPRRGVSRGAIAAAVLAVAAASTGVVALRVITARGAPHATPAPAAAPSDAAKPETAADSPPTAPATTESASAEPEKSARAPTVSARPTASALRSARPSAAATAAPSSTTTMHIQRNF